MDIHQHDTIKFNDDETDHLEGILKNSSNSFISPLPSTSPEKQSVSPPLLPDPVENKELTLQNTLQNAGRRSSSARRSSAGRRLSGTSFAGQGDDSSPRLKWDEANLYLAEQEKTAKMKIDEPKTPWAPHYDPLQDDMETDVESRTLDAHDLVVDELDKVDGARHRRTVKDTDIPDLELGEPEEDYNAPDRGEDRITRERSLSAGEKHVVVNNEQDGEQPMSTAESQEKHREFEERRKRHYEMKNIKDLLGSVFDEASLLSHTSH